MSKTIIRCDRSGVLFGEVVSQNKQVVELKNVRKIYYWDGAFCVEGLASIGTTKPQNCKLTQTVESMVVTDAIQIIPCTAEAERILSAIPDYKF